MIDAKWLRGAASGFLATFPMTATMLVAHRLLPQGQRYPLPPRLITERWLDKDAGENQTLAWTLLNHFAFGAFAGSLYTASRLDNHKPALSGPAYGIGVWAISYLGWVPAMGFMPPATRQPSERNAMMIAAHLVWGAALAGAAVALSGKTTTSSTQPAQPATLLAAGGRATSRHDEA